jgi:hypothetical protein
MRTRIVAAMLFFFVASPARAQPGTAEGVDAFVRGDYQRAADILKPIAEHSPDRDHVAEFFLRGLLGREAFEECSWRATVGFDHRLEPVTFALGPGRWIAWDRRDPSAALDRHRKQG